MLLAYVLLAENQSPDSGMGGLGMFVPFIAILALAYFMMIRPMRRQEAERQSMLRNLKKNDKVVTSGGIIGTVVSSDDKEPDVVLKVDDNVRLRVLKSHVTQNLTQEEAARQAKEQKTGTP